MQKHQYDELVKTASLAGKIMLESGGEISRVEQTIVHLSTALGAAECEVFATPTTIILSLLDSEGEVHSMVRRISQRGTRLDKVQAVNSLSREAAAQPMQVADVQTRLCEIQSMKRYTLPVRVLASGAGAGAFAIFLGGGMAEALCALVCGALLCLCQRALETIQPNLFAANLVGGALAAFFALVCYMLGLTPGWESVTIAVMMLMVPGVAMTNALRDIAAGELLAGISRTVEALCIGAALACGAAFVYAVIQALGGVVL